jgi:hypothetical protein
MNNITKACQQLQRSDATLTLLNLNCEYIESQGVQKLAKSCCSCSNTTPKRPTPHSPLVALWLETNEIYTKGAEALSKVIIKSPSLKYLYLTNNPIYDSGISKLCQAAAHQLEVFHAGECKIGPAGARDIAGVLLDNKSTVVTLVLDNNHLRDQGASSIAEALRENTALKTLDLRYNCIGKEGISAFRDVLKDENKTLQCLLLEEDHDEDNCKRRRSRRGFKFPRVMIQDKGPCTCEMCPIREDIDFYLALNRAGRHFFANNHISEGLWPRILANVSEDEPSVLYTLLDFYRPELIPSE